MAEDNTKPKDVTQGFISGATGKADAATEQLRDKESLTSAAATTNASTILGAKESESSSSAIRSHISNVVGKSMPAGIGKGLIKGKGAFKKAGPPTLLGIILMAIFMMFSSQASFFQSFTSLINNKYDFSGHFNTRRTEKILSLKVSQKTKGFVGTNMFGKARYGKLSSKMVTKFQNNGFHMFDLDGMEINAGKIKKGQLGFIMDDAGNTFTAKEFSNSYYGDAKFRASVDKVYKGRIATWFDDKIDWIRGKMGIKPDSPRGTPTDELDDMADDIVGQDAKKAAKEAMEEQLSYEGKRSMETGGKYKVEEAGVDANGNKMYTVAADDAEKGAIKYAEKMTQEEAEAMVKTLGDQAEQVSKIKTALGGLKKGGFVKNAVNFISAIGWADTLCQIQQFAASVGPAARTLRKQETTNAATVALADMEKIKAGVADTEVTSVMGDKFFSTSTYDVPKTDSNASEDFDIEKIGDYIGDYGNNVEQSEPKGGTESQGYSFLAGAGQMAGLDPSLMSMIAGVGGFIMDLLGILAGGAIEPILTPVCGVISNPWVQVGAAVAGLALMFFSGGGAGAIKKALEEGLSTAIKKGATTLAKGIVKTLVSKEGVKMLAQMALPFVLGWAAEGLSKIVAGEVCKAVVGQDYSNCVISGAGAMNSQAATGGGGLMMNAESARASLQEYNEYIAMVAEDDRNALSPFDTSSPYTFLGSIAAKIYPYSLSNPTATAIASGMTGVLSSSVAALFPPVSALSDNSVLATDGYCDDKEYKNHNVATDPMCNPIVGIPAGYMDSDRFSPDNILQTYGVKWGVLPDNYQSADWDGTLVTQDEWKDGRLKDYVNKCVGHSFSDDITGIHPLCVWGDGVNDDDETIAAALFYIDNRIEENLTGSGMDRISGIAETYAYENNIRYYDITELSDTTIIALQEQKDLARQNNPIGIVKGFFDSISGTRYGVSGL
jgi:hypothetical protein